MSNQSLANKYRSTTFDDLVGQDHISNILKYQVAHHTRQANYLFFWPRGTGKTSSARLFAKAINCLNTTDGNPCNSCTNCVAISKGNSMDIMEIDAASHTGVDNIREEIIEKLAYRPTMLKKRITIIDEVHMLSKGAFNALLKTMEEPSEWMVFILATTELNKVPETIISRCQLFNFKKIPFWQIQERLSYISSQENITTTPWGLQMIAHLSDGCMRDAVKYLDQISVMGSVDEASVGQFLGVVSDTLISTFVELYAQLQKNDASSDIAYREIVDFLTELSWQGIDLTLFPKQLMTYTDTHFATAPALYSQISQFASALISQSKRYPHPLVMYKTILFQLNPTTKDQTVVLTPTPLPDGKRDSSPSITSSNENKISDKSEDQKNEESRDSDGYPSPDKDEGTGVRFVSLLSPSLKNLLDGQCEIKEINGNTATLIVINPMAKMTLNKKENQDAICHAISQTTGQTVSHLEISFMSKDDYFAWKMR